MRRAYHPCLTSPRDGAGWGYTARAVRVAAPEPGEPEAVAALDETDAVLRDQLVALLAEHDGNISAVSRATGKARWQIHRWLRRFALDPASHRR